MKKATIQDVAKEAGVSVGTVSRFLNGDGLRDYNRIRIETAMAKLKFRRNLNAASMRQRRQLTVGIALPRADYLNLDILARLTASLRSHEFNVSPYIPGRNAVTYDLLHDHFRQNRVDLLVVSDCGEFSGDFQNLRALGVPLLRFGGVEPTADVDQILVDETDAAQVVSECLVALSHREIAVVECVASSPGERQVIVELTRALANQGVELDPSRQTHLRHDDKRASQETLMRLFDRPNPPTAVVCSSVEVTQAVLGFMTEREIEPGRAVSLVCLGDSPFFSSIGRGICAQSLPAEKMTNALTHICMSRLLGMDAEVDAITKNLKREFIRRGSLRSATTENQQFAI